MYGPGFSLESTNSMFLPKLLQKLLACSSTSWSNGSLPDGNAPSCLDITYLFSPTGVGPVVVVAHPISRNGRTKNNLTLDIS